MTRDKFHEELMTVLNDGRMDSDQQAVAIEALVDQYISTHDNKLLNSLSEVFDRSRRNLG